MTTLVTFRIVVGATLSHPDPELYRITHAFEAAFQRMCAATTEDGLVDELSNMLHHLYRLGELCKIRLTNSTFYQMLTTTKDLRAARAALWVRNRDTHNLFVTASQEAVYSGYYTAMYGVSTWIPRTALPNPTDNYGRDVDYDAELEGEPILDTLRRAFDAMAALL